MNYLLDSNHPIEVKEQVLCIIGNIAAGSVESDYVLDNEILMIKLSEMIVNLFVR